MGMRQPVLVNSLPKSGTNLLTSILELFPSLRFQQLTLNRNLRWHPLNLLPSADRCLVGVDQPVWVTGRTLRHVLKKAGPSTYCSGHLPHSPVLESALLDLTIKTAVVLRDPRDVVVSQIFHVMQRKSHFLHSHFSSLPSDRERLMVAIAGIQDHRGRQIATGIREKLLMMSPWFSTSEAQIFFFEELVGEAGGGSREAQEAAILRLAELVGIALTTRKVREIGASAFGTGSTFRSGRTGGWRQHFDDEIKTLFKEEAGSLLIDLGYERVDDW